MKKTFNLLLLILLLCAGEAVAQSEYQPYSYQLYQKFDSYLYSTKTRATTSLKPVFVNDTLLKRPFDSIMNYGVDTTGHHSWFHRKLFDEHLIDVKDKDYTFYADFLLDNTLGRDLSGHKTTWLNTKGYQIGGTISDKFYFYTSGYENQAKFPQYITDYIDNNPAHIVLGQAYDRNYPKNLVSSDWSYVTALLSYTPVKYINITLGHDKNFIGDGYRSLLLSDYAAPYDFLKLTGNLGNVTYMAMWGFMDDPTAPTFSYQDGDRRKWMAVHYLNWNVSNRVSLGFFDAVIWADKDNNGNKRGFDFSYSSPVIFLRPLEASNGSPDNAMIGFTGKYKITDGITAYGQFALDEFQYKDFFSNKGSSRNKYAYQLGFRGANLFGVKRLNYLVEYNGAKPYTYSEQESINNYSEEGEPLAHPWGANFREVVGLLNYSYKRWDFSGELDYGLYGYDINGLDYGKNIFESYTKPARVYGNYIGQGLRTNLYYGSGAIAYVLNPKYNLRIEGEVTLRRETNDSYTHNMALFSFGIRSSFRNIYKDF